MHRHKLAADKLLVLYDDIGEMLGDGIGVKKIIKENTLSGKSFAEIGKRLKDIMDKNEFPECKVLKSIRRFVSMGVPKIYRTCKKEDMYAFALGDNFYMLEGCKRALSLVILGEKRIKFMTFSVGKVLPEFWAPPNIEDIGKSIEDMGKSVFNHGS